MAKRMTDTEKWKKPFLKQLPAEYKLLWFYILDDCDHAGIWQVDMEVAEIRLGVKLSEEKARGLLSEKVVVFDNGTKWFIPDFIDFQYGKLTEKNKMYNPVHSVLMKYNLMGHLSPINGVKEKVQVKDKEVVEGGVGETDPVVHNGMLIPEMMNEWKKHLPNYPESLKTDFHALQQIASFICKQSGVPYEPRGSDSVEIVQTTWKSLAEFIANHKFFRSYSIQQVSKHIQSIIQDQRNEFNTGQPGRTNGARKGRGISAEEYENFVNS